MVFNNMVQQHGPTEVESVLVPDFGSEENMVQQQPQEEQGREGEQNAKRVNNMYRIQMNKMTKTSEQYKLKMRVLWLLSVCLRKKLADMFLGLA